MTFRFALITGATSGIGEAFARRLPSGTGLLLTGRDEARLIALKAELANGGRPIETLSADLSSELGRRAVIAAGEAHSIDLLINNAGLGQAGRVIDNPPEREREMAEVNVVAPVVLTRALLPGMIARVRKEDRRAGVILVSSVMGFQPAPLMATYAASKAFDLLYAEGLGAELSGEPVDVLALCPGGTETNFGARAGMKSSGLADSADKVARQGLSALGRRPVHIVGGRNRVLPLLPRVLPRQAMTSLFRRAVTSMMER